jgi:peroxiredoxin
MNSLKLGDKAPDFTAPTTQGEINFYEWLGDAWGILFSHPADFTPVCTTELGSMSKFKLEFDERNVKILAISVDPLESHKSWIKDINETQKTEVNYPIIADADQKVAKAYGMLHPKVSETKTVRSVFIIGPDKTIRLTLTYPASTGRNFHELLRVVDSLQLTENKQLATPANWNTGDDVIISPAVTDKEAEKRFPGYTTIKPYLRTTSMKA